MFKNFYLCLKHIRLDFKAVLYSSNVNTLLTALKPLRSQSDAIYIQYKYYVLFPAK